MQSRIWTAVCLLVGGLSLFVSGCLGEPCLADNGGCSNTSKIELQPCASGTDGVINLDELAELGDVADQIVTVQGPLLATAGICTQLACSPIESCCNGCGGSFFMSNNADSPGFAELGDLDLNGAVDGTQLACGGDDSLVCCPLPKRGLTVQVTGTLNEPTVVGTRQMNVQGMCLVK
mgnify:CR=1 FL=1